MSKLAELIAKVTYQGDCVFMPTVVVNQERDDTGPGLPVSFDVALDYDESRIIAIRAPARRTRGRVVWQGADLVFGRVGDVTYSFSVKTGEFQTMDFRTRGAIWSMPSVDTATPVYDPCLPIVQQPGRRTPYAWGNKLVEFYIGLASGYAIKEFKLFRGLTLQKSNSKDTGVDATFSAVDMSILYSKKPLCLQIPPFAGFHRGEIVKLAAANVGLDPADVICPLGGLITKPILLSNASLLPFIEELGKPENWWARFDEQGKLRVEALEIKEEPDFTLDAAEGGYIYDSLTETLPSQPPTAYYVTASITVKDGEDDVVTTVRIEEIRAFYAPETVKVSAVGNASYLYSDGSYRSLPVEQFMVISRTITTSKKKRGREFFNHIERWLFYNPLAKDDNFDALPPGTNYDHAYGDKTFHRDETESLMKVSDDILEAKLDTDGTLLQTIASLKGWRSEKHALEFFYPTTHRDPINRPGVAYMYPGPVMRVDPVEQYGLIQRTTTDIIYGSDGTQSDENVSIEKFFSPPARCDIFHDNPDTPPVPGPVAPPPKPRPWGPGIVGPIGRSRNTFSFELDFSAAPELLSVSGTATLIAPGPAFVLVGGSGGFGWSVPSTVSFGDSFPKRAAISATIFSGNGAPTTKPAGFLYAQIQCVATISTGPNAGTSYSAILHFDPWSGLPPGADISVL